MMRDLFKKTKYVQMPIKQKQVDIIPEGVWIKCPNCGEILFKDDFDKNNGVCSFCKAHHRIGAYDRLSQVLDEGTFVEMDKELSTLNVLNFPNYEEKISKAQEKSNLEEAVVTGIGQVGGLSTVIAVMDSRFMMGSMGYVVGEKITRAIETATKKKLPILIFTASGGARMQEGIMSLMQMAKTSAALAKHHQQGLLYVTVLTDPTTGGVTASFAMLGDIIISEPGALIGFAGPRVIQQTIGQKLPEGFQRAEFLLEHGFIDRIIKRKHMKEELHKILLLHSKEAFYE